MDAELFRQIWPIFSAEAREHLAVISSGILALEAEPARVALLDPIRRTAHSLKGSAASLGLGDVERLAHAVEGSLALYDPVAGLSRDAVQAVLDAIEGIEEALATADSGGTPAISSLDALLSALGVRTTPHRRASDPALPAKAVPAPEPEPAVPVGDPLAALDAALEALCAPIPAEARGRLATDAAEVARQLAATAAPAARELAGRVAVAFTGLAVGGGAEVARTAAALAGDLVDLRQKLERGDAPPQVPVVEPNRPTDKSIRVLSSTLDSLARQLELLALSESRHARRSREVGSQEQEVRESVRVLEQAVHALRLGGLDGERNQVEGAVRRLRVVLGELNRLARDGQRESEQQRLAGAVLRDDLRALRMVPAALMLEPLRRAVRDVAGRLGKQVELEVAGADMKLDRRVVDELRDPLLHLVRNAVDHGIESPEARRAAGKGPVGRLLVRIEPRGSRVGVVVEDDGGGLDVAAIRAIAVKNGLLSGDAATRLSDAETVHLLFVAGFSTAKSITEISGRGVGLDVVQETVTRLGGAVDVTFVAGRSTRFDLELPLTLAATAAILVRLGRELGALSADAVERVILLAPGDVGTVAGRSTVRVGDAQLPFAPLATLVGLAPTAEAGKVRPALLLAVGTQRAVVAVDEVLGQQEVVVGTLGPRMGRVPHLAGASVLDDGRIVAVLNAAELLRRIQPASARVQLAAPSRIVVADDSLTTRSAMKALLEMAGYQVTAAGDGEEAFQIVRDQGAALVVSDVQMPRLDGLGLTRRMKGDPRLRAIPVILVTSLDTAEDRAAGLEAGADGYVVKREVERGRLLELVRQLLPGGDVIRVLIADDSTTFRAVLRHILEREPGLEVIGQAADGEDAVRQVLLLRPDVVTMDVRMPLKNGLDAIEEIMARAPTPVVVVSAEAGPERQELAFQALARGAIEVLGKPSSTGAGDYDAQAAAIRLAVRAVAGLRLVTRRRGASAAALASLGTALTPAPASLSAAMPAAGSRALTPSRPVQAQPHRAQPIRAVGIAASTGGPPALARILAGLPREFPAPILVVQHIAQGFESGLVRWLDRETPLRVKLAEHGEPLQAGTVYLAAPDRHLHPLAGTAFLGQAPPVRGFRPSANALFRGMANELGGQAAGLILTGMGDDGAEGLEALRAAGGLTFAQGPATSVVFGMPREALERGAATEALELEEIAPRLVRLVQRPPASRS